MNNKFLEDRMRILANRLIDRILEDKKNGVLKFLNKQDTLIKATFSFRFIDYATYAIPDEN